MTPFRLVQLSDPHIGGDWAEPDPVARLAAVVESVRGLIGTPDAVLVSGDLVEHGSDDEYATVHELLAPLAGAPIHVLPGNHDDRAGLRRGFGLGGGATDPVHYAVELGALRLVVLDSTVPGQDFGELDAGQLRWLDDELAAAPGRPTLIALHHSPTATGVPGIDEIGMTGDSRAALASVVASHSQVRLVVAGHLHRSIVARLGGVPALTAPGIYVQTGIDFAARQWHLTDEPAAYVIHTIDDGEIVSYVQSLD